MPKTASSHPTDSTRRAFSSQSTVAFRGQLAERQVEILMSWSEHVLSNQNWPLPTHKRAMRCIIELLQNLAKHAGVGSYECGLDEGGGFRLVSTNVVHPMQEEHIRRAWTQANEPELSELRKSRLEKLVEGERTKKGGAGLGFMDLRACSNGQVDAEFIPCGNEQSTFVLTVRIQP